MGTALFFLYLAGVTDGLSQVLMVTSITTGAVTGIGVFFSLMIRDLDNSDFGINLCKKYLRTAIITIVVTALLSALLPSKQLLYVAAGLAASEELSQSEMAQKAYTILNRRLDELLADE